MKKHIALLAALLCLLTACMNHPDAPQNTGPDAQNKYQFSSVFSFQETEGFYCGNSMFGKKLNYYDKESGISGTICPDPACAHDSAECAAYMEAGATLSVYDGRLYWIGEDAQSRDKCLWRSSLAGTEREMVKKISFEDVILPYQPQRYVVHRGTLYMHGNAQTVVGTETSSRLTLIAAPLDDSGDFTVLQEEYYTCGVEQTVRFIGDQAYCSTFTYVPGSGCVDVTITKLSLSDGISETVYTEAGVKGSTRSVWVTEAGEIYLPWADEDRASVWKIEDGARREVCSWPAVGPSVPDVLDGIAVYLTRPDNVRYIEIASHSGEPIYSGTLFPDGIPGIHDNPNLYNIALIGGDREKLILNLQHISEQGLIDYTVLLDIQNGLKPTVLWDSLN